MDPVTGALILGGASGLLGSIGGWLEGDSKRDQARKAREELKEGWGQYKQASDANISYLNDLLRGYGDTTGKYGSKFDQMLAQGVGQYKAGQFAPEDIQQWLDPNVDYRIQRAANAIENSAAGRNQLLSGATQKRLQDRSQQIAQEAWDSARTAGLNAFTANESAKQAEASSGQNAINNILSMYNSNLGAKTGLESQGLQMRQNQADQLMNYYGTRANLRTESNPWTGMAQGFAQGVSPWATAFANAWGQSSTTNTSTGTK